MNKFVVTAAIVAAGMAAAAAAWSAQSEQPGSHQAVAVFCDAAREGSPWGAPAPVVIPPGQQ